MSSSGLRLDNFYAQPTCSPTRGSVPDGAASNRWRNLRPGYSIRLKEITTSTLSKMLEVPHILKWHVGPVRNHPRLTLEPWALIIGFPMIISLRWIRSSLNGGPPKKFYGESSEIIVDEAIKYIESNRQEDKPFPSSFGTDLPTSHTADLTLI